ncbi:hypothetical protein M9Y10_013455 [Tritrichomonas musculus]|uniref:Uncharacterized protein n=1 Tax=Tritrichomonas musculus TaxID=1915356 RepID=A0ABR2I746_9EUKA
MQFDKAIQAKNNESRRLSKSLENHQWFIQAYDAEYRYFSTIDPESSICQWVILTTLTH